MLRRKNSLRAKSVYYQKSNFTWGIYRALLLQ
jgi:hypothetical protein